MSQKNERRSRLTTGGMGRAPNRAMLRAVGFLDEDFDRPMIGVASLFSDITPCNAHLDRLARKGYEGVRAAGGVPQIFGAPTASDGIMMGHQGMRYSLVSREVIADSIEVVAGGMNHDGVLAVGGCDKNMPGCLMAMARLNVPSVFVYGGSILPGIGEAGEDLDIVSIFEAVGRNQAGKLDAKGVHKVECEACPKPRHGTFDCVQRGRCAVKTHRPTAALAHRGQVTLVHASVGVRGDASIKHCAPNSHQAGFIACKQERRSIASVIAPQRSTCISSHLSPTPY